MIGQLIDAFLPGETQLRSAPTLSMFILVIISVCPGQTWTAQLLDRNIDINNLEYIFRVCPGQTCMSTAHLKATSILGIHTHN
jgi:hypothetical protein